MMAAANPRRLDDVDEVVFLVNERQIGPEVVDALMQDVLDQLFHVISPSSKLFVSNPVKQRELHI